MQHVSRFETLSDELTRAYDDADAGARRRAAIAGIEHALATIELNDRPALDAFENLKNGGKLSSAQIAELREAERRYDGHAYAKSDDDGEPTLVSLESFNAARVIAAIVFAARGNFDESLYEANAASSGVEEGDDGDSPFIALAIDHLRSP